MIKKIKCTRPQLKRYRQELARYQHYLPMLKLKQQQLQMCIRDVNALCAQMAQAVDELTRAIETALG